MGAVSRGTWPASILDDPGRLHTAIDGGLMAIPHRACFAFLFYKDAKKRILLSLSSQRYQGVKSSGDCQNLRLYLIHGHLANWLVRQLHRSLSIPNFSILILSSSHFSTCSIHCSRIFMHSAKQSDAAALFMRARCPTFTRSSNLTPKR